MNEFQKWILHVIEIVDEPPGYIFDLLDFDGYMKDIRRIMGFTPDWSPSKDEISAISAIALLRGIDPFEPVDDIKCKKALYQNPGILDKFKEMFPFIRITAQFAARERKKCAP